MKPYYDADGITIYHGDCIAVIDSLEPTFDHVITDPPYSDYVHSKSRRGSDLDDGISRARDFGFCAITHELRTWSAYRMASARRWILVFSDVESSGEWRRALDFANLDYVRTGAWVKDNPTPQFTGDRPAIGFEAITICHPKGKKRWNGGGRPALWRHAVVINRSHNDPRLHTAQKPITLMRELIELFTDPGDLILDPFMGSGTTLRAAKDLGRRAIGIEINEKYCEIAARRMAQAVLAMPL